MLFMSQVTTSEPFYGYFIYVPCKEAVWGQNGREDFFVWGLSFMLQVINSSNN